MHSANSHGSGDARPISLKWSLIFGAFGATGIGLTVAGQIYLSMLDHGHSFARIAVWQICSWSVWAAATPVVVRLGARLTDRPVSFARAALPLAMTGVGIFAAHALVAGVATVWLQPYVPVQVFRFGSALIIQTLSLPVDILVYGLLLLSGAALAAYQKARNLELRESRLEADLARAQLDALRLEIEPHFLFNSLNSIASLIRTRAGDRALSMLLELSELLRAAVDGRRQHTTTLAEEAGVREAVRRAAADPFQRSTRCPLRHLARVEQCKLPSFLLQPVVENAFRHGFARRSGSCRLELAASVDSGQLHVSVRDDGAGLPPDFNLAEHAGTGLGNARLRLQRLYNGAAQLELERADDGGTIAHIRLPLQTTGGQLER